jgi:hypothetical protein
MPGASGGCSGFDDRRAVSDFDNIADGRAQRQVEVEFLADSQGDHAANDQIHAEDGEVIAGDELMIVVVGGRLIWAGLMVEFVDPC